MVRVTVENRFDAPPDFVRDWLTDFRPDDGQRFFGEKGLMKVRREGNRIHRESEMPLGTNKVVVTIESPTRWVAQGEVWKGGKVVMRGHIVETVAPAGKGTLHRADINMEPVSLPLRLLLPIMAGPMRRDLVKGFARMKGEMEAEYRAGKPPTA